MFYTPNKKNPTYLISTPSGQYFRLCVPKDLQEIVGKSRARLLAGLIQQLFVKIRSNRTGYGRQQVILPLGCQKA
jgi:hypothetical protein